MSSHSLYPPFQHQGPSQPISSEEVLTRIQAYLSMAATSAYLHPDCRFTEHGPTFAAHAGVGGLVLHQLRRVEAGLRGENLGLELEEFEADDAMENGMQDVTQFTGGATTLNGIEENVDVTTVGKGFKDSREMDTNDSVENDVDNGVEDWENKDYNQQMEEQDEPGIVEGEMGPRNNAVGNASQIPKVHATSQKRPRDADETALDKDARKRLKKERKKEDKTQREQERLAKHITSYNESPILPINNEQKLAVNQPESAKQKELKEESSKRKEKKREQKSHDKTVTAEAESRDSAVIDQEKASKAERKRKRRKERETEIDK